MESQTQLAPQIVDARRRYLCRHIFTDGHRCASPALRGLDFCYYHRAARPPMPIGGRTGLFTMPRIDERAAIQIALFEILSRISAGDLDLRRANSLLYGLQIASSNLTRVAGAQAPNLPAGPPLVEEIDHDFHLGDLAPIAELPSDPSAIPIAAVSRAPQLSPSPGIDETGGAAGFSPRQPCPAYPEASASGHRLSSSPPESDSEPSGCPIQVAPWVGNAESFADKPGAAESEGPPAHNRVPIPPSCYARAPEVIPSHAAQRARIAGEIHSAVQSAVRRCQPAISPEESP